MKVIYLFSLAGMIVFITGGCVTNKPLPPGLHTESKSAGSVKIVSVELLHDDSGLLVHGTVERQLGYFDSPFRHLDLEVLEPTGKTLTHQAVNFFPNPIPFSRTVAGRATYSVRLATSPPPNSTVRVSVDCSLLSECKLATIAK